MQMGGMMYINMVKERPFHHFTPVKRAVNNEVPKERRLTKLQRLTQDASMVVTPGTNSFRFLLDSKLDGDSISKRTAMIETQQDEVQRTSPEPSLEIIDHSPLVFPEVPKYKGFSKNPSPKKPKEIKPTPQIEVIPVKEILLERHRKTRSYIQLESDARRQIVLPAKPQKPQKQKPHGEFKSVTELMKTYNEMDSFREMRNFFDYRRNTSQMQA